MHIHAQCHVRRGVIYTDADSAAKMKALYPNRKIEAATAEQMAAFDAEMQALEAKYGKRAIYGPDCTLP